MIPEMEMEEMDAQAKQIDETVFLDPDQKSLRAKDFEERLGARIVGQERAVRRMSGLYQIFLAGMNPPNRPIGTMLFLEPTGSGKSQIIKGVSEVLFADPNGGVKNDCTEFQHSHEIAKLIGSPPGYADHRETSPMLTQESLDRMHQRKDPKEELQRFVIYFIVRLFAVHSLSAIVLLYLQGCGHLHLSNGPLMSLLGSTFGEAAAVFVIVARYLFPRNTL